MSWWRLCVLAVLCMAPPSVAGAEQDDNPGCRPEYVQARFMWAQWPDAGPLYDLYDLQWSTDNFAGAYRSFTSASAYQLMFDLQPATRYDVRVRGHIRGGNQWAWSSFDNFTCTTAPAPAGKPTNVRRVGTVPHTSWVEVAFDLPGAATTTRAARDAGDLAVEMFIGASPGQPLRPVLGNSTWASAGSVPAGQTSFNTTGLPAGSLIYIRVGGSAPQGFLTSQPGIRYQTMYRLAEQDSNLDFLTDHNSGDILADTLFSTVTSAGSNRWVADFNATVMGEYCVAMVDEEWANYSSCMMGAPPSPSLPHGGDPNCACAAWQDRAIGHQPRLDKTCHCPSGNPLPASPLDGMCDANATNTSAGGGGTCSDFPVPKMNCAEMKLLGICPKLKAGYGLCCQTCFDCADICTISHQPSCDCSIDDQSYSHYYPGRLPVYLPFYGVPGAPDETAVGYWYSTPKGGECGPTEDVYLGQCAWMRRGYQTAVRGFQLIAAGFTPYLANASDPVPKENDLFYSNGNVTQKVFAAAGGRCCGC